MRAHPRMQLVKEAGTSTARTKRSIPSSLADSSVVGFRSNYGSYPPEMWKAYGAARCHIEISMGEMLQGRRATLTSLGVATLRTGTSALDALVYFLAESSAAFEISAVSVINL